MPAGNVARETNGETIRVRGGQGELPVRQMKATLQFFADPDGVLRGQHQRDSTIELRLRGGNGGCGGMSGHGSGIAEAEIDVAMSVDIDDFGSVSFADERRKCSGPFGHPVHGHAAEERFAGAGEERFRFGMGGREIFLFGLH